MKLFLLSFSVILCSLFCSAQGLDVPENYDLLNAEDYAQYEDEVLECIEWLQKTPLNKELETRAAASTFLIDWISGSPNVSILLDSGFMPFMTSSPHLILTFMAGWTERDLKTRDYSNNLEGVMAGLEAVMDVYISNLDTTGKDKRVEKLIKLEAKHKLEEWVKSKLPK